MRLALHCLLSLFMVATPALAGESVEADLEKARKLVEKKKWKPAAAALRQIFKDHEESPEVGAYIGDIEKLLKQSLFRLDVPELDPKTYFGKGVKKYDKRKGILELEYKKGPGGDHWKEDNPDVWRLEIGFRGDVKVNLEGEVRTSDEPKTPYVVIHWDGKTGKGYQVFPGLLIKANAKRGGWKGEAAVTQLGKMKRFLTKKEPPETEPGRHRFEFERKGMKISAKFNRKVTVATSDKALEAGQVVVIGWKVANLKIKGVLDRQWWDEVCRTRDDEARERWEANTWKRDEEIPAWAGGARDE
ncbi:MAG: hypothetical protein ACYTG4_02180 [Planctomycetota bacterium]|jgi:hypothetical protein